MLPFAVLGLRAVSPSAHSYTHLVACFENCWKSELRKPRNPYPFFLFSCFTSLFRFWIEMNTNLTLGSSSRKTNDPGMCSFWKRIVNIVYGIPEFPSATPPRHRKWKHIRISDFVSSSVLVIFLFLFSSTFLFKFLSHSLSYTLEISIDSPYL